MMEVIRATEEWQKAGVYYVRYETMCRGFQVPMQMEFEGDRPGDEYVLVMEGNEPVSTCRIHVLENGVGQVERVVSRPEFQKKHYGKAGIEEAERWLAEKGVKEIQINSREAALGFYEKLGYEPDFSQKSGSGEFCCVMTRKRL